MLTLKKKNLLKVGNNLIMRLKHAERSSLYSTYITKLYIHCHSMTR